MPGNGCSDVLMMVGHVDAARLFAQEVYAGAAILLGA
jgi:hypothetical protein